MVRPSVFRTSKYAKKIEGDVSKRRADDYGGMQKSIFKSSIGRQVEIEIAVKGILNRYFVSPLQSNYYILYAKRLQRMVKNRLHGEKQVIFNHWLGRRLWHYVLYRIAYELFKIKVDDPVALWPFWKGEGIIAYDLSGFENNGTINGATWVKGLIGNGLFFDGLNDNIVVPHNSSLNFGTGNFSVEIWLNTEFFTGQRIICKGFEDPVTLFRGWEVYQSGRYIEAYIFDGVNDAGGIHGVNIIADGKWHHIAVTRNSQWLSVYVDGELDTQCNCSIVGCVDSPTPLYIGSSQPPYIPYWKGTLDEVRIYPRVLTQKEVQTPIVPLII